MSRYQVQVLKKVPFLCTIVDEFCNNALISFEGDLQQVDFGNFPSAIFEPTDVLNRNTLQPIQDFVILPLENNTVEEIKRRVIEQIGIKNRILHLQIARQGELVFGAYDNFAKECVWVTDQVSVAKLKTLKEEKILEYFYHVKD